MYNDAGVNIHIHKCPFGQTDDDIEFNFQIAKALGCKAITTERNDDLAKRLSPFAAKHKIWVAFHNHTNNIPTIEDIDPLMQIGDYIGFNLDIGHYIAGTKGKSPIPVIEKYHDKIISLHLKDRTADGGNLPWGQGQTPIKEVLQLLKKEKWPIYADIELEYKVPSGSDAVKEPQERRFNRREPDRYPSCRPRVPPTQAELTQPPRISRATRASPALRRHFHLRPLPCLRNLPIRIQPYRR